MECGKERVDFLDAHERFHLVRVKLSLTMLSRQGDKLSLPFQPLPVRCSISDSASSSHGVEEPCASQYQHGDDFVRSVALREKGFEEGSETSVWHKARCNREWFLRTSVESSVVGLLLRTSSLPLCSVCYAHNDPRSMGPGKLVKKFLEHEKEAIKCFKEAEKLEREMLKRVKKMRLLKGKALGGGGTKYLKVSPLCRRSPLIPLCFAGTAPAPQRAEPRD